VNPYQIKLDKEYGSHLIYAPDDSDNLCVDREGEKGRFIEKGVDGKNWF